MSDLSSYIDLDGLVGLHPQTEPKVCGSQNGFMYTAIAYVLTGKDSYALDVARAFAKFGYRRNSVTQDVISFDDGFALVAFLEVVRNDFKKNYGWHPSRTSNSLRWWFFRNPVFLSCVYFPTGYSLLRDISICITGLFELGSTPFLVSFLISELYPTSEWAKRQLRKRAFKRFSLWDQTSRYHNGLTGAFEVYFGGLHPLVELSAAFEVKRNRSLRRTSERTSDQ